MVSFSGDEIGGGFTPTTRLGKLRRNAALWAGGEKSDMDVKEALDGGRRAA
ncbi:hypothetical protein [Roseovarius sp. MMSF_3281]|uniref:hypothetical protein n=1 Tax=Roseovarius sp. MMSF_3281 TaxID=3046694 RepID=UPI00273D319D|nr:hypothetical protein [Roseovarius sp. MMSF_3281]